MEIKSALLGAGGAVVLAGGLFFAVAASNAENGTIPAPSPSVTIATATPTPTPTPEPAVTETPAPIVEAPPVVEPAPVAPVAPPVVEPAPVVPANGPYYAPPETVAPAPATGGLPIAVPMSGNPNKDAGPGITPIAPKP